MQSATNPPSKGVNARAELMLLLVASIACAIVLTAAIADRSSQGVGTMKLAHVLALAVTSGAMAVALARPVVVLMGPTDPRYTAMHLERQRVLREEVECSPCHLKVCPIDHRCMEWLRPERAVAAAEELLA